MIGKRPSTKSVHQMGRFWNKLALTRNKLYTRYPWPNQRPILQACAPSFLSSRIREMHLVRWKATLSSRARLAYRPLGRVRARAKVSCIQWDNTFPDGGGCVESQTSANCWKIKITSFLMQSSLVIVCKIYLLARALGLKAEQPLGQARARR